MEKENGLTEFLGTRDVAIPCILKHLYSDFIVQEIAADKTVCRLVHSSEVGVVSDFLFRLDYRLSLL